MHTPPELHPAVFGLTVTQVERAAHDETAEKLVELQQRLEVCR